MTERDYAFLFDLVRRRSGLALGPEKRYLADSRLAPVCQAHGFGDLATLVLALRLRPGEALVTAVVDALATHETYFFRDRLVFDALRGTVLPNLGQRASGRPVRIWSAAASTGQEAYSIAILAADLFGAGWETRVEIVASDMVAGVIERARAGTYSQAEVQRGLPIRALLTHFDQTGLAWTVTPAIRQAIAWRVLNLFGDLRGLGQFDVIFCRNLLIYLDGPTKRDLLDRLAGRLAPGGLLCLGSAESTLGHSPAWLPHETLRGFFVARGDATWAAAAAPRARGGPLAG